MIKTFVFLQIFIEKLETCWDSFSAVWTATIARKDAFFCIFKSADKRSRRKEKREKRKGKKGKDMRIGAAASFTLRRVTLLQEPPHFP